MTLDTRDRLIAAARDELAEHDLAALGLRAVARRAGLSHAAPAHFFGDRAGLLTAVATAGFDDLSRALDAASGDLASLGKAYVTFGREHPALLDLMFRGSDLRTDDQALIEAKRGAVDRLVQAVGAGGSTDVASWTVISWALVHGLVVLGREQAMAPVAGRDAGTDLELALELIDRYAERITGA